MSGTVLFVWRRTPPPLLIGGAEVSQQLLAEEFAAAGWTTAYLGSFEPPWNGLSQLPELRAHFTRAGVPFEDAGLELRYRWNGVDCIAVTQHRLERVFARHALSMSPDLVVTSQERAADLAGLARRAGLPTVGWLHSVSGTSQGVLHGRPDFALATSRFVHHRMRPAAGTRPVVFYPPFTHPAEGDCQHPAGRGAPPHLEPAAPVLMVNPVPAKGAELLHHIVRAMPQQRFTLVEGWWDTSADFRPYPNVSYLPRTYDMGALYRAHRLLLVPSLVEDAFPRVIVEAGLHGVPSIGTDRGGIPEAIGEGGIALPSGDAADWVKAIETADIARLGDRARQRAVPLTRPCLPELTATGIIS